MPDRGLQRIPRLDKNCHLSETKTNKKLETNLLTTSKPKHPTKRLFKNLLVCNFKA